MSANNQILVKEYKGKFLVYSNIMAESWCELDENDEVIEGRDNELSLKEAKGSFDTRDEAYEFARKLEIDEIDNGFGGHEYGVQFERLYKDGTDVKILG